MEALDNIKNSLIDRIKSTENKQLLQAINSIFESTQTDSLISLRSEQIEMLMMSEKDIENGNLVSESKLGKSDDEWLD